MNLPQTLKHIQNSLLPIAGEFALPESERILEFLLGASRTNLYLERHEELSPEILKKIGSIISRRLLTDEPLAYILGCTYFFDREITVTPEVLIPRLDTETLIETVLLNEPLHHLRFLDFGTGSGCISAVLAGSHRHWKGIAVDASMPALRIARKNCGSEVDLICCSFFSAIKPNSFDFIVSNPPYIPSETVPTLDRSVRDFEPIAALDGGADGLDFYRFLANSGKALLSMGGRIYCEISCDQGEAVKKIMVANGWNNIIVINDLGGRPRVIHGRFKP